jgi:hypothetical protein
MRSKVGDLRPSQLLFTFGVGSIVDLPYLCAMVMGLDDWDTGQMSEIGEERLLAAVREYLGRQVERLYSPPYLLEGNGGIRNPFDEGSNIGVPVVPFPRWVRCPRCNLLAPLGSGVFELKVEPYHPEKTRYVHANCPKQGKPPIVLPVRFLMACQNGHLEDFPWVTYVHGGQSDCRPAILRLQEFGVSGEAADIWIKCETCGKTRSMVDAFGEDALPLPQCRGKRPHLRDREEGCQEPMKTILLGASNSWFPIPLSALSIPSSSSKLDQLVEDNWSTLKEAVSKEILAAFRQIGQLRVFAEFSDEEVWAAVQVKQSTSDKSLEGSPDLKQPEWEVFSQPDIAPLTPDFQLREVQVSRGYEHLIARVVLVERLREVRTLLGFTRIESPGDFSDLGEIPEDRQASLSRRPPHWVPATEVRGEGIFIQFNQDAIDSWCDQPTVAVREREFSEAHRRWRHVRRITPEDSGFPGICYVLIHSFSHALMRQLTLECGYTAASIRERIYSRSRDALGGSMAGLLIYTAAPDSEGTLGGLVGMGEPDSLGRAMDQALEDIRCCASDPLCAEHNPHREGVTLHGAACHACLFAPETSCERGNRYLDRNVLVKVFGSDTTAFFEARE